MEMYYIVGVATLFAIFFIVFLLCFVRGKIKADTAQVSDETAPSTGFVFDILLRARKSLKEQNAVGFQCWIASCIDKVKEGVEVPPEVALEAIRRTRDELSAPRYVKEGEPTIYFNLDGLNEAIVLLEEHMGEWD